MLVAAIRAYAWLDRVLEGVGTRLGGAPPAAAKGSCDGSDPSDSEPDGSVGPILARSDGPELFAILDELARDLGGAFPTEVRLSYLPACGVVDLSHCPGEHRRVLIVGLPCFLILRVDELRAVLAHELAHLWLEDSAAARKLLEFTAKWRNARLRPHRRWGWLSPRRALDRVVGRPLAAAATRVNHAIEYRADDLSAQWYGARPLASALEKLAIVQPIFRELLLLYDPLSEPSESVYEYFARVWKRLDRRQYRRLRKRFVKQALVTRLDAHPPIHRRIRRLTGPAWTAQRRPTPAAKLLAAPRELMNLLHNRLYAVHDEPTSVFQPFH